jgi:lipopolysaccharide transport protein LptA
MTGAAQKISAVAAAIVLGLGLGLAPFSHPALAQDEPEPEASPMGEPQAEPTEWVPITAGDAARGAPASPEAETSPASAGAAAQVATPVEVASPAAISSPASLAMPPSTNWHTTIGRSRPAQAPTPQAEASKESPAPTPVAAPSTGTTPERTPRKGTKAGGNGPQIVPENSPFAGMGFGNQKGPTNITSDSATLDYQNKFFLYTGHVHAVQAGGDLTSDTLKAQYGQDFNDIKMIYADGNVRMSQGTRWITSDHAVLDQTKHMLTFTGNPVAHDAADQITGSVITVDLVTGKSNVENPRVVIFPRESKNPDNVDSPVSP